MLARETKTAEDAEDAEGIKGLLLGDVGRPGGFPNSQTNRAFSYSSASSAVFHSQS